MTEFVVFQNSAAAPGDPLPLVALVTEADDAPAAAENIVNAGIFTGGAVYVLDASAAETFLIDVNPSVAVVGGKPASLLS